MNGLIINGISVAVDQEGFLVDLDDWSEPVAEALANAEESPSKPNTGKSFGCCASFIRSFSCRPQRVR